jgi:hypothetical protein
MTFTDKESDHQSSIHGESGDEGESRCSNSDQQTSKSATTGGEVNHAESIKQEFALTETGYILSLRVLVIVLLIIVAAGVCVLVFVISRNAENDEVEVQFEGASQQILKAFDAIKTDRISALSSLAVAAIAHGVDHSRSWPFVALSSFQQRSLTARSNSGILQVSINTFVPEEKRDEWERYVVEEVDSQWIQNAYDYQEETGVEDFIIAYGENFNVGVESQSIAYFDPEDHTRVYSPQGSGPYLPYWETSPLVSNSDINIDIFADSSHKKHAMACLETGSVLLGGMLRSASGGSTDGMPNSPTSRYAQLLSIAAGQDKKYLGDPMTYVYIPIFDSFRDDRKPKAVMIGLFNWARFFENVVPPHVRGVDVVLHNPCYESYTYQIFGSVVVPVGNGVSVSL